MFIINAFFFKSFGSEDTKPIDREREPTAWPLCFFHKNYHDYSRRASATNHLSCAIKFPIRCNCPGFISQALRLSQADLFRICHAHSVTFSLPLVMLRLLLRKLLHPHPRSCSKNEFLIRRKHGKISTQDMCFPSSGIWVFLVVEWIRKECGVAACAHQELGSHVNFMICCVSSALGHVTDTPALYSF